MPHIRIGTLCISIYRFGRNNSSVILIDARRSRLLTSAHIILELLPPNFRSPLFTQSYLGDLPQTNMILATGSCRRDRRKFVQPKMLFGTGTRGSQTKQTRRRRAASNHSTQASSLVFLQPVSVEAAGSEATNAWIFDRATVTGPVLT